MTTLKGFIFDMDGVVVDNHPYHFSAWMEFSKKHNYPLTEEIYRDRFNGKTNADLFPMMFGNISESDIKKYSLEKEEMYRKTYLEHMMAHKGLVDYLEFLKSKKMKVALGTSAPTENVDFVLDHLKLRKYFDVIVDGTMVKKGKPDPEVYQLCCMRLGLEPSQCVVFEDSLAGLESGKRAGCSIVGIATSHKAYELKPLTDQIVHDFTEPLVKGLVG